MRWAVPTEPCASPVCPPLAIWPPQEAAKGQILWGPGGRQEGLTLESTISTVSFFFFFLQAQFYHTLLSKKRYYRGKVFTPLNDHLIYLKRISLNAVAYF